VISQVLPVSGSHLEFPCEGNVEEKFTAKKDIGIALGILSRGHGTCDTRGR